MSEAPPLNVIDLAVSRRRLWEAVDKLTRPSHMRVHRDQSDAEWLQGLADDPTITVCDVAAYRAATKGWGETPPLWQQAELALTTGSEASEGGGVPLRERSPADLDLMETMLTIRESMSWQLSGRSIKPRAGIMNQMRQLAAHIAGNEPQHTDWWTFRFEQWVRVLAKQLHAVDSGPRAVRLRNAACPECKTKQVTIDQDGEKIVVGPILIDFDNGWIRAATCIACMATWWRGDDLGALADLLDQMADKPSTELTA